MEAIYSKPALALIEWTPTVALVAGEVFQLPWGEAAVAMNDIAAGGLGTVRRSGRHYPVAKTASQVWIKGDPLWWDHSANAATCNEPIGAGDRDFYLGVAGDDALAADTTGSVYLNQQVAWIIDSARDNGDTTIVKTVVGSTTVEVPQVYNRGGMLFMQFGTTAEAQKVNWISDRSFALGSNWIADILLEIVTAPDNAAVDIDVGVANGDHDTNFETIGEFAAFHLDGDDTTIDAHSDDGGTDTTITTTGLSWTAGTPVRLKLDGRDPTNVKYYVNGAEVNEATSGMGVLTAATGPLFAIIHAEKTSDDSPLGLRGRIRVRTMQD